LRARPEERRALTKTLVESRNFKSDTTPGWRHVQERGTAARAAEKAVEYRLENQMWAILPVLPVKFVFCAW